MMAGDSLNARKFAKKADYPDSLIKLSKIYLSSVPLNGILITNGDNDTYPLWYLQEIQKYRPDVVVLNYSLLGMRRYLSFLDQSYKHSLFSIQGKSYLNYNLDYFIFRNSQKSDINVNVNNFLKDLVNNHNPYYKGNDEYYRGEIVKGYYSRNLFFTKYKNKKTAIFKINDYLMMNEFLLLDILNTSKKRKIYFTFRNDILSTILRQKGIVYEVEFK
jgi:hypothetical protein